MVKMITKEQLGELLQNGSEYVRTQPEDSLRLCNSIADVINYYDAQWRDHIIGFDKKADGWGNYEPVFDTETQAKWDDALDRFNADKAAWCAKYGCE